MTDFRRVTDTFTTSPQIEIADVARAAEQGFRLLISNRPDGETPDQPSAAEVAAAAAATGLAFRHIPVRGGPTREQVDEMQAAIVEADGPVLAFCRSGTRSIVTWALGQALTGQRSPAELIDLGQAAGYDLSGVLS